MDNQGVQVWSWLTDLTLGFATAWEWLTTEIWQGFTPLTLLGFGGLTIFLAVAIVKWIAS